MDWFFDFGCVSRDTAFADRNGAAKILHTNVAPQIIVAFDTIIECGCDKVKKIIAHATTFPPK
ncbi:MAG: hypothetical protein Rhims3KO_09000 [Hyphomicrobiales bacterium]